MPGASRVVPPSRAKSRASAGTPTGAPHDFATPYLTFMLGFIGITDVTFLDVPAEATPAEIDAPGLWERAVTLAERRA